MQQTSCTQSIELAYEKNLESSFIIYGEEQARILRVGMLLLKIENDDLNTQLSQGGQRTGDLEMALQESRVSLNLVGAERDNLRAELRTKAEFDSLYDVSLDATKLLTEKLALSRELANLMPEIEHLRSQAASQQALLAEKLMLQRQLSTIQVELENEKRATRQALAREGGRQENDARTELRLEGLLSDLAKEQKEKQKVLREMLKAAADSESKTAVLESRLEGFRTKLRMTKDQLKETQSELKISSNLDRDQAIPLASASMALPDKNPRKRSIACIDTDANLGTPGVLAVAKRGTRVSALPGDKSTFSITPYLNRTASLAPESPTGRETSPEFQPETEVPNAGPEHEPSVTKPEKTFGVSESGGMVVQSKREIRVPKQNILASAKVGKPSVGGPPRRKRSVLEKVQEEDNEEKQQPVRVPEVGCQQNAVANPCKKLTSKDDTAEDTAEDTTFIKRKRKLLGGGLGRTLFDEEDGVLLKDHDRGLLGGRRTFGSLGKTFTVGQASSHTSSFDSTKSFGDFSPLKKDRRPGIC
ncbi:MAG: hypothetical protein Q9187_007307 [Circinaria calcarea]